MAFTQRSAPARAAILAAAQRRFALDGYERATIRSIAAEAEVDPSMVIRYFGSKADLYAAASVIDLSLPELAGATAEEIAVRYAHSMLVRWERGDNVAEAVLLRTAPTHTDAARRVQAIFEQQVVAALRAARPGDPDIERRAALVLSQTLGVVYCRYLLELEPLASMPLDEVAVAVGKAVELHLTEPLGGKTG